MNLDPQEIIINPGIAGQAMDLLSQAIEATAETGRASSVAITYKTRVDPDSLNTICIAKVSASWPLNDLESKKTALPAVPILKVKPGNDGQFDLFADQEA